MTKLDDFTKEMLTNPEMLKVNQHSINNRQVSREKNLIVWTADVPNSKDKYVALFNAQTKGENLDLNNADYVSPIIAGKGSSQKIEVSVKDGKKLVLFVKDGGNTNDWDHFVWVDPVLHGPKGDLKLTSLKWLGATSGWGEANVNRTCDNNPIIINNETREGIGAHAESVIVYLLAANQWRRPSRQTGGRHRCLPVGMRCRGPAASARSGVAPSRHSRQAWLRAISPSRTD
jgi:hypothetical protein